MHRFGSFVLYVWLIISSIRKTNIRHELLIKVYSTLLSMNVEMRFKLDRPLCHFDILGTAFDLDYLEKVLP